MAKSVRLWWRDESRSLRGRTRDSLERREVGGVPFYVGRTDPVDLGTLYNGDGTPVSSEHARSIAVAALAGMEPTERAAVLKAYGAEGGQFDPDATGAIRTAVGDRRMADGARVAQGMRTRIQAMNAAAKTFWDDIAAKSARR